AGRRLDPRLYAPCASAPPSVGRIAPLPRPRRTRSKAGGQEPRFELRGRQRRAVEVALRLVAPRLQQVIVLGLILDTFRDRAHIEGVGEGDDGRDQGAAVAVGGEPARER